jgi:hypothetical protein
MQQLARRHSLKIIDDNQKLRSELESKMQELDSRSKELDELASQSDYDRRNLQQEKEKVCDGLLLVCSFLLSRNFKVLLSLLFYIFLFWLQG